MKVLIVLGLIVAVVSAVPIDEIPKVEDLVAEASQPDVVVVNEPVVANEPLVVNEPSVVVQEQDVSPKFANLTSLVGSANIANLTAIIQQLVKEEVSKIILNLQSAKNSTLSIFNSLVNNDDGDQPISQEINKQDQPQEAEPKKPVYFLPRRPGYFPPPMPFFYGGQQPVPYYNPEPYFYRGSEGRYGGAGPQWRAINPTNDESMSEMEALAELEMMYNQKVGLDEEGRGLMSSISSTTNSAKAGFKSFVQAISAAKPPFSIVKKTYLVPGLAISG